MTVATDSPIAFDLSVGVYLAPDWSTQSTVEACLENDQSGSAIFVQQNLSAVETNRLGQAPMDFGDEFIYERTWIIPNSIELGLLINTQVRNVSFWNAFRNVTITLEHITGQGVYAGTSVNESNLPDVLTPTAELTYVLTVTLDGPSNLDCYHQFEHDYTSPFNRLVLTGTRILFFPFKHDWSSNYTINYAAETVIAKNKKFYEQRRPLYPVLNREISMIDTLSPSVKIKNLLNAYINYMVAIAIFTESMTLNMTGSLLGLTTIPVNETIANFWNLSVATHVVLWNTETDETEICELVSYTTSLVVAEAILSNWDATDVIIYPVMLGTISSAKISSITNSTDKISIKMKESLYYV